MSTIPIRLWFQDGCEVDFSFPAAPSMELSTATPQPLSFDVGTIVDSSRPYEGSYEITPSAAAQVLPTASLRMTDDLTINPIPSNYGLITWNGSTITVS